MHTTICGIPGQVKIIYYSKALEMRRFRDGSCAPPEPEELVYVIQDRYGRNAPWLEKKMTDQDRLALEKELWDNRKIEEYDL